jgi:FkbM family methyltransferase
MTAIHRALLRIRPEPLAALVKALLGISRREVETPFGKFFVDPASNFGVRLLSREGYEPLETEEILRLTHDARTFVDVGANEGYFSVVAAKNMGAGGRVLAIEPQQRLLPVLQRNMALNGLSFEVITYAITDNDTTAEMFFSTSINTGTTGLVRTTAYPRPRKTVPAARLERILRETRMPVVDCMKMDIEGLEYEAILGSRQLFESKSIKRILVEMHPNQMIRRGNDPSRLVEFLRACGYSNDGMAWRVS